MHKRSLATATIRIVLAVALCSFSLFNITDTSASILQPFDPPQTLSQPGGVGTPENPYRIGTCEQLEQYGDISYKSYNASAILLNDLDCPESATWGKSNLGFRGIKGISQGQYFDGRDHTISNLHQHTTQHSPTL